MMGAIYYAYHMVVIRIKCGCEYKKTLKNTMQIAMMLFLHVFFPCIRRKAVQDSSKNTGFAISLAFKSGLCFLTVERLEQVIYPLHLGFLICKMGIIINHIQDNAVRIVPIP